MRDLRNAPAWLFRFRVSVAGWQGGGALAAGPFAHGVVGGWREAVRAC